jgi:hypothetical protein
MLIIINPAMTMKSRTAIKTQLPYFQFVYSWIVSHIYVHPYPFLLNLNITKVIHEIIFFHIQQKLPKILTFRIV